MSRKYIYTLLSCLLCLLPMHSVAQSINQCEYWFDDGFGIRQTIGMSGQDALLDTYINTGTLSSGAHKLYYRFRQSDGKYTAVATASFFKFGLGESKLLEYWFDGDRENAHRLPGETPSDDGDAIVFAHDLDLSGITPGHHRLYYRVVSQNGKTAGSVSMTPVMVRSKYDNIDTTNVTVTEQAYWIDDDEPEVTYVARPMGEITQPYTFDTRKLTDGKHTLHMQYANSAGIWNGSNSVTFTKEKVTEPQITATASVENGVVTAKFNSIPNGYSYVFVRKYPSGKLIKVEDVRNTDYPAILHSIDTPGLGTYTYYVDGYYTDADGKSQKVHSTEICLTVDKAASNVKRGSIYGVLLEVTGTGEQNLNLWSSTYNVYVNGIDVHEAGYNCLKQDGSFKISDVPYGTEVTISVKNRKYSFNDITLVVSEVTSNNTYYFDGTQDGEDIQPDNDSFDLIMISDVVITPDAWELAVKNKMKKTTWDGDIIVKIISKETKEMFEKAAPGEKFSTWYFLTHPNAGLDWGPVPYTSAKSHIHLDGGAYKDLALDITYLPAGDEAEDFYIYVYSQKEGSDEIKELSGAYYPQKLKFNPSNFYVTQSSVDLIKEYKTILEYLKKMSNWGTPFDKEIKTKDIDKLIDCLGNGDATVDLIADGFVGIGSQSVGMLVKEFLSDTHKSITNKAKTTKELLKPSESIITIYNTLNGFYNSTNQVDDNHKFFESAKQVLNLPGIKNDPTLSVYKSYLEVGEALANAVTVINTKIKDSKVWMRLVENSNNTYNIKVRCFSNGTTGGPFFSGENVWSQIKSIEFKLESKANNISQTTMKFEKRLLSDGITLNNVDFGRGNDADHYTGAELWMIITWKNNRVTHIPLLDPYFTKIENLDKDFSLPINMTVELQSETNMKVDRIPTKLTIIKQK